MDDLLNPTQAGEYVGMTRQALGDMRYRGAGPKYSKLSARAVRYRRSDLDAWIASRAVEPAPKGAA